MALRGETYTARPKRSSDGAVSAKYKKAKTIDKDEEKLNRRLISERLTATKRAVPVPTSEQPSKTKSFDARGTIHNAISDQARKPADAPKGAQKKAGARKTPAGKEAAPKGAQRTAGGKAPPPVRRAVMATPKQAQRARRDKERRAARGRRDRKRADAAKRDRMRAVSRGVDARVTLIALLTAAFVAGGLLLCAVHKAGEVDLQALSLMALMAPLGLLTSLALPRVLPIDPLIMALTNFLCGVGVVVLYTVSPSRGVRQASYYVLGLAAMIVVSVLVSRKKRFKGLTRLAMVLGVVALVLPLAFGKWAGGAKNWVELPVVGSFQPSELVKLSLVLAMAYYFSAHRTVWQMMPAILFAGACLLLLMLQRDLGTALIYYATTLAMFYVACGNVPLTIAGLGGGVGAAMLGYKMFAHVKVRVAMWRNPWSDPLDKGYQIIQALLAIGSGGLFGVGLGQGTPEKIPAYYNDFIYAVICEQLGLVFGVLLLLVYVILILRGVTVIGRSRRSFDMLLGCGVLTMLAIQTFMIVAGVIKMLPLTGVTMPFLSYGGSSLLSCLSMIGILHGIAARAQEELEEDVLTVKG